MKIGYNETQEKCDNKLHEKVKRELLNLIKTATTNNIYKGFNVDKENEKLFCEFLKLENIIFNFDLLKENNNMLYIKLQNRNRVTTDLREKQRINSLMTSLIHNFLDIHKLTIVEIYTVLKEDEEAFKEALIQTPFTKVKILQKNDAEKDFFIKSENQLNNQTERIKSYLQYKINLKDAAEEVLMNYLDNTKNDNEHYFNYLLENINKAKNMQKSFNKAIIDAGYVNEAYFSLFLNNLQRIEPGYLYQAKLNQEKEKTLQM